MTMLTIALFELRARLRLVSTWLYFVLYALLAGLWMAAAGGAIEGALVSFGSEKIFINSPYALMQAIAILGFMGLTVIAAMSGRAVQQDFEYGTFHFFFTAPIAKRDYFFGRLLGAYATLLLVFIGIAAGLEIGAHWPGVDAARLGPFSVQAFLRPYAYAVLPNMLWLGGGFFVLAALTRAMAPVYIAGVIVLVGYLLSLTLLGDMENKTLAALIDPVGSTAMDVLVRYWSVADKNTRQVPLTGVLLWNRAIWIGFGIVMTTFGYRKFRMEVGVARVSRRTRKAAARMASTVIASTVATSPQPLRLDRGAFAYLRMLPGMTALYLGVTLKSPRFLAVVLAGALFVIGNAATLGTIYGTNTWPMTYKVLEVASGLFSLFILVITAINAGELVWRERDARIDEISDSGPAPTWLPFAAKLATLFATQAVLLMVVMVCSIGIQLWQGYYKLEIGHYLFDLFLVQMPGYWIVAALALTIHVLVNQKYLGHFLVVLFFVVRFKLPDYGFQNRLYLYGLTPEVIYSDLNGYGHFLPALRWFQLYWAAAAVLLLALSNWLWVRGKDTHWRARLQIAIQRIAPPSATTAAIAILVFAGAGGWIFYNTHVLNPFRTQYGNQKLKAEYEHRYKPLAQAPQPSITAVDIRVDMFPHEHRVRLNGTLMLLNKTAQAITDLYITLPPTADIRRLDAGIPSTLADAAPELYWHHYRLQQPLAPGATTSFMFDLEYAAHGFRNDGASRMVLDNGTFLNAGLTPETMLIPSFGYDESAELESDRDRKKFGLAPKQRMHDLDDAAAQQHNALSRDADWIDYRATLSTDVDQIATTSGYLQKDWTENGRRYFEYRMDSKMADLYSFQSARYAVKRDRWTDGTHEVAIELDYQPGHEYNLDRMIAGVKDSLDYYTKHFGPYQHRLVRILEFPRFSRNGSFAESFPNTIPYNESIGFTARVDDQDPKDIDYPYFITAHEVAHQWWAHQENPANVQGAEFITESLAEYSALLVLKHKFGDVKMQRFLKYELDGYLLGRSTESKQEQPLLRADGASYIHYQKGSLALYALQDAIGEEAVDQALSTFVHKWAFQGPPYATSRDLLADFRAITPPDQQYLIDDLFETITLYDNRATQARYRELGDGKYEVELGVEARKFRADGLGAETEVPMQDAIDIGVLDDKGAPILLRKEPVHSGASSFKLVVDKKPAKAGIDPLNKLIDRTPEDNVMPVEKS